MQVAAGLFWILAFAGFALIYGRLLLSPQGRLPKTFAEHAADSTEQDVGQTTSVATCGHCFYALEEGQHAIPFKSIPRRLQE